MKRTYNQQIPGKIRYVTCYVGGFFMPSELIRVSAKFHINLYEQLLKISENTGENLSETIRKLIVKGLNERVYENNTDLIAQVIRQQLEIVMKPHIERLAALSSKSGHMSATAAYLNVQALMDLVAKEQRKDVRVMYESARKKAAGYMKIKVEDWKNDIGVE